MYIADEPVGFFITDMLSHKTLKYLQTIDTFNTCCKRWRRKHKFMELFCDCRLPANHYALLDEMMIPDNDTDILAKLQYQ